MNLQTFIAQKNLEEYLLTPAQTKGFVCGMAAAPYIIDPSQWLAFLWGDVEESPFESAEDLETYANLIVEEWNLSRQSLLNNTWQWPQEASLDEAEIVNEFAREYCEGLLQAIQITHDDWENLMPEDSEDNALLGGVMLTISMLYDPDTSLAILQEQDADIDALAQFEEIYNAIPNMLCGLCMRGQMLANEED